MKRWSRMQVVVEPIMMIDEAVDTVVACQFALEFSNGGIRQIIISKWRLGGTDDFISFSVEVGCISQIIPISKASSPKSIVERFLVILWKVENEDFGKYNWSILVRILIKVGMVGEMRFSGVLHCL